MRLLVAAGASGGGVYPALAVLQELDNDDLELLWVGGEGGLEEDLVARAGYPLRTLPAAGLHGVGLLSLPGNLWQLGRGYFAARRLLREFKPDVMFFTGGFVAAPVAAAGSRIPALAFVPDIRPGFTLRFIARFANKIAVVVDETRKYFSNQDRVKVTGYPIRKEIRRWKRADAMKHFELSDSLPTLLVFGGSKGAQSINRALAAALPELLREMQILHVTGIGNWEEAQAAMADLDANLSANYHPYPYLHDDMGAAFAAADLAVCRAGASTLGELPVFGLPAVLVPIPIKGHLQQVNADYLQERGAAIVLQDSELPNSLAETVRGLTKDKGRAAGMQNAMTSLVAVDAAKQIAGLLRELGKGAAPA
ncbi:MAG: undecaprenyldiphospho-muramoylpentapeptide beta-N-acetylglucosaminyltransferase [Anaerolineales bacterium]